MIKFPTIPYEHFEFLKNLYPDVSGITQTATSIEVMQSIRSYFVNKIGKGTTNLDLQTVRLGDFHFNYTYARQNLRLQDNPALNEIYPGLTSKSAPYYSSFHSSGQSAMSSALIGISLNLGTTSFESPVTPYFETPQLFDILNKRHTKPDNPILLIDSTSLSFDDVDYFVKQSSLHKFIIIDTSLWVWNDPLLQKLIDELEGKNNLFLIRSHLKLDCLGGEYSTLGSLVYMPSQQTSSKEKDRIVEDIQMASSAIGACPSMDQIFPFYKNPKFHELTIKRMDEIKDSTQRIVSAVENFIDKSKIRIEKPYHSLFYKLILDTDNEMLKKLVLKFLRNENAPVYLADSYGFDFSTVLIYCKTSTPEIQNIRLNGHALGKKFDDQIIEAHKKVILVANNSIANK